MKDLGWTAFFALLVCVIAIFYLGKEKDGSAVLVTDDYQYMEVPSEAEPPAEPVVQNPRIREENLDFYPKTSARESERVSRANKSTPAPVASKKSSSRKSAREDSDHYTAKAATSSVTVATASAAKREAARKLNERAVAEEKNLAMEKKRSSASFQSAEKKLKNAIKKEDFQAANEAASEMEEELGVEVKFQPKKSGEKLPENPLFRKRN